MSRTLCFLSMLVCLATAPAARADSFATQPVKVFPFPRRPHSSVPDGYFQPRIDGPNASPQMLISRMNDGGPLRNTPTNPPARVSIPEPATLALLGTGFVCLSLGLRALRAKVKFEK